MLGIVTLKKRPVKEGSIIRRALLEGSKNSEKKRDLKIKAKTS